MDHSHRLDNNKLHVMAIYVDNVTGKIIASPAGYTGIATDAACCCDANPCDPNPEILLTVTGASGTVNWCGEQWTLPGDSGLQKSLCPTNYGKGTYAGGFRHYWKKAITYTGLYLGRFVHSGSWRHSIRIQDTAFRGQNFRTSTAGTTSLYSYYLSLLSTASPSPTISNYDIPNNFFGSTTISGITYAWARGQGW